MADAGLGVEAPAREFRLEFLPLQTERYFLLCDERSLEGPVLQELLALLRGAAFRAAVDRLPGYRCEDAGEVLALEEAFASLRGTAAAARG